MTFFELKIDAFQLDTLHIEHVDLLSKRVTLSDLPRNTSVVHIARTFMFPYESKETRCYDASGTKYFATQRTCLTHALLALYAVCGRELDCAILLVRLLSVLNEKLIKLKVTLGWSCKYVV